MNFKNQINRPFTRPENNVNVKNYKYRSINIKNNTYVNIYINSLYNQHLGDLMVDESGTNIDVAFEKNPIHMGSIEYEMIELFRKINISRPVALTLACLAKGREVSSQSIEVVSGLRQPEVSVAMRYLRENEWIHIREEKKSKGKGRPIKLYKLTVPMDCIVGTIEQEIIAESRHVLQNIERLKNIA